MADSLWSVGFTFVPNDEQMVKLLQERLSGCSAPAQLSGIAITSITDVNVYGDLSPEEIFNQSGPVHQKERYCFTPLKRKTEGGQRFVRTTGGGTWKLQSKVKIFDSITGEPIGVKNYFSYQAHCRAVCSWGMYEFSLNSQTGDYAICKIKRTRESRKRERDENVSACSSVPTKIQCTGSISVIENTAPSTDASVIDDQSQPIDWMAELFGTDPSSSNAVYVEEDNLSCSVEELFGGFFTQ